MNQHPVHQLTRVMPALKRTRLTASAWRKTSSETQGQLVGRETKSKRAGKNSTSKKYKLKIGAPGDKHCTDQFQTAEQILAPDWAENLLYFSAQSAGSKG